MRTLLLVEDDSALRKILSDRFREHGYRVLAAESAGEAMSLIKDHRIALALIDVGLPDEDGFTLARKIVEQFSIPFIFLTAMGSPEYRLEGYELGAADYIPKPFHFKELLLRVERVLGPLKDGESGVKSPLIFQELSLHPTTLELRIENLPSQRLTEREFSLLYALIQEQPHIIPRERILRELWKVEEEQTPARAVDNVILKLRSMLGPTLAHHIHSVRGLGYHWLA